MKSRFTVVKRRGERGFSLVLIAVSAAVMLGMLGLAYDVGRMLILKTELQSFTDASAMAAVSKLDGTNSGVVTANSVATVGPLGSTKPNGYDFDTLAISDAVASYATAFGGTYDSYSTASSQATNSYRFVNVSATQSVPLTFLPILPGIPTSASLTVSSTAGQQAQSDWTNAGAVPFGPEAHNPNDLTGFGLTPGGSYTLKWANGNTTSCTGDAGFPMGSVGPDGHGFMNIGEGTGTSGITQAIDYGGFPNSTTTPATLYDGESLDQDPGNRGAAIFNALQARANQDTDQTDLTISAYETALAAGLANGRRIVTAPIVNPATWSGTGSNASVTMIGFGNFLLPPGADISGSSGNFCGTYIGPADVNGTAAGGSDGTKIYVNFLYK